MTAATARSLAVPSEGVIGVLGAGTMGGGIAWVAAEHGHTVRLYDVRDGAVAAALAEVRTRLERSVATGARSADHVEALLSRITPARSLAELGDAALVIEAIAEDLDAKRAVLGRLEEIVAPPAVLATNTSSLSVTAVAACLARPERMVGIHFFNPAPVMSLVEIVHGDATSAETAALAAATVEAWGKTAVHCTSTPGFIVNRVARPFYGEALRLLGEGAADAPTLDAIVTGAGGFPMGPFVLIDLIGVDVNLAVSMSIYEQTFHDPRFTPHVLQQTLVDAGRLGRKSGRGFYDYPVSGVPRHAMVETGRIPLPEGAPEIEVVGDLGHAAAIVDRLAGAGVTLAHIDRAGVPGHLRMGRAVYVPTDGRTATELAALEVLGTAEVAVIDLALDWCETPLIAMAQAAQAGADLAVLLAGVLSEAGIGVCEVADVPGLVLMRIVAQLASVAADAVMLGVATPADIDTAMRLGTNYPLGPIEWTDRIGAQTVVSVLDNLRAFYGEDRYRASGLLRRNALAGLGLGEGDLR